MLFSRLSLFCLVSSVLATPAPPPATQKVSVTETIKTISNKINKLDVALKQRPGSGSPDTARSITQNLLTLSKDSIAESKKGARYIREGSLITYAESLVVGTLLTSMQMTLTSTTKGWIDSKRMVVAAGMQQDVLNTLYDASDATNLFADTLISKMPMGTGTVGLFTKEQFVRIIEPGITEYLKNN
ncbi:hypothetical protein EJ08DRAFT_660698 [Tothia fuscella]|uniref:Uncharacterized protein n=1 Tax=Tothia fuscella TaxID=1048955 RepID=A0A9P4NR07_9PEZI|nr:hypothetical protein EJ08DRAFT_660698 [Tothia fuscella]